MLLAKVIIEYPSSSLDRPFFYGTDQEDLLIKGIRVKVPFANKLIIGYVIDVIKVNITKEEFEKENGYVLKKINAFIDKEPILNDELFTLAKKISNYYFSPLISVLQTMLPPSLKPNSSSLNKAKIAYEKYLEVIDKEENDLTLKQKEVYEKIKELKIDKKANYSTSIVKTLLAKKYLKEILIEKNRLEEESYDKEDFLTLNEEQNRVKEHVLSYEDEVILLEGVTGSGKTEVYLHLTKEYIKKGKNILVLLPEISLTYQVVKLFKKRFKNIALLHSGLTNSEKYDEYRRILKGEVNVVVGARSAIFAPLKNIGLIIIDEEHSESYKQDQNPFYHVLTVAKFRKEEEHFNILLGSATPSLESRARAFKGNYKLEFLNHRISTSLPKTSIIDMSSLKEVDEKSIIYSKTLRSKIQDRLNKNEQIMIMLNRRGYASYISCRRCSYVFRCPTCNLPLTFHKDENLLKCHHCGYVTYMINNCPKCDSTYIKQGGIGLQKAEEELKNLFPEARILRLDSDVAKSRLAPKEIIEKFQNHEADILLGSQMISKGLDFKNVTLSCVLLADIGLNIPSFRASEKVFSLITQAIGRAGRSKDGEAIIQTYSPFNYAITLASKQDYETFFNIEMKHRKITSYPPYSYLCILSLSSLKEEDVLEILPYIKNFLEVQFNHKKVAIIGPSEYYVSFYKGRFRRKFLLKYYDYEDIKGPLLKLKEYVNNLHNVNLSIDIDPLEDY